MDELKPLLQTFLLKHPNLKFSEKGNAFEIKFEKSCKNGFSIFLSLLPKEKILSLSTDCGFHDHFHITAFDSPRAALNQVLSQFEQMMSGQIRIKIISKGGRPVKWIAELNSSSSTKNWSEVSSTGLLFFNFFRKKTQQILMNSSEN